MKLSVKLAVALIAYAMVGTVIGVAARLPYQFGGVGDPARIAEDFVARGTAVSPPLVALMILVVAIIIAAQRGRVGRIGSSLLAVLAAIFLVPTLGEMLGAGAFSGVAQVFVIGWSLIGAAMIAAICVSGVREALGQGK
jgi:hypothetical protein